MSELRCVIENVIVRKAVMSVLKGAGLSESSNAGQSTVYLQDDRHYGEVFAASVSYYTKVSIEELLEHVKKLGEKIRIGDYDVTFDSKGESCEAAGVKFEHKMVKTIVEEMKNRVK